MIVHIYDIDDDTGAEILRATCDLSACELGDEEAHARQYLITSGRYWTGGGSAPLVLLTRATHWQP